MIPAFYINRNLMSLKFLIISWYYWALFHWLGHTCIFFILCFLRGSFCIMFVYLMFSPWKFLYNVCVFAVSRSMPTSAALDVVAKNLNLKFFEVCHGLINFLYGSSFAIVWSYNLVIHCSNARFQLDGSFLVIWWMLVYVQFAGKKVLELVSLLCLCMCSKSSYAWNSY
jgi:hypothetical protein